MRILFWGTPAFAVPSLRALLGEGHEVVGVVTRADTPRGRSRSQFDPSPVKIVALEEGLPVIQPDKPRGDEFMRAMSELSPNISVVVAYGRILPHAVIDLPPLGTLNIHASLLPALRGAAPIQAAILGGLQETGITIVQMVPSALRALLAVPAFEQARLRYVISGGEALDRSLAAALQARLPQARIGNFYGPTENSIDATFCEWPIDTGASTVVPKRIHRRHG